MRRSRRCVGVALAEVSDSRVSRSVVPEVRRSLDNGRALQELLQQAAPRYIKALKRERAKAPKMKKG